MLILTEYIAKHELKLLYGTIDIKKLYLSLYA